MQPKTYECPYCDWKGSRGGRSKHVRSKHAAPEAQNEPAETPAEPSASTAPVLAGLQGESIPVRLGPTRSGRVIRGSFRLSGNDLDLPNPNFESTRIVSDQSETLSTEPSSVGEDRLDPTYRPY